MTKRQRARIKSQAHYEEQFAKRVTLAERLILQTILFPEMISRTDEEDWPTIFDIARDIVNEARYELAFSSMTEEEHEAMRAKLSKLEKAGHPLPGPDTFEGFCLGASPMMADLALRRAR